MTPVEQFFSGGAGFCFGIILVVIGLIAAALGHMKIALALAVAGATLMVVSGRTFSRSLVHDEPGDTS